MRKYQVSLKIVDFEHGRDEYTIYADANDFYSAIMKAVNQIYSLYTNKNGSSFGRCDYSMNDGETYYDDTH